MWSKLTKSTAMEKKTLVRWKLAWKYTKYLKSSTPMMHICNHIQMRLKWTLKQTTAAPGFLSLGKSLTGTGTNFE